MYLKSWLAALTNQPLLARRRKYLISQLAVLTYQPLSVKVELSDPSTSYYVPSSYKKVEVSAQLSSYDLPSYLFLPEGGGICSVG
jgi:hypothetical protein